METRHGIQQEEPATTLQGVEQTFSPQQLAARILRGELLGHPDPTRVRRFQMEQQQLNRREPGGEVELL